MNIKDIKNLKRIPNSDTNNEILHSLRQLTYATSAEQVLLALALDGYSISLNTVKTKLKYLHSKEIIAYDNKLGWFIKQ